MVSVACFYLSLPAVWLLLGRLGLARSRRLLVLGLMLTCPVYFIYARAFMMETMALMFSLWFLQAFVAAVETARPAHYQKTNWFACTPVSLCDENDREACAWGMRGARFFGQALGTYYTPLRRPIGPIQVDRSFLKDDELDDMMETRGAPDAPAMNVVGDPAHCKEIVSRFKDAGIDELILVMQAGTIPHDRIMKSIRLFGDKVMPHFA